MHAYADVTQLLAQCQSLATTTLEPRRKLHLPTWQDEWEDHLAMLSNALKDDVFQLHTTEMETSDLEDACIQWSNVAETASTLLRLALDRGTPAHVLRPLYLSVVAVWGGYATVLEHAHQAGHTQQTGPIRTDTAQYQFALQLLAMAVLLDEEGEIPTIVEQLLHTRTDRLLDYLSAAAMDLEEANDHCLHAQPFEGLNEFFDQYGEVTPDPLQPYLEQHYSRFFALSPSEQKKEPRLQGPQAWDWWALEVGALVALYGLDDSALRSNPHYPADLVDYALGVRD